MHVTSVLTIVIGVIYIILPSTGHWDEHLKNYKMKGT